MLRFILYFILFYIVAILQTVVVPQIKVLGAQPSFLLILTVTVALNHGTLAGCFVGFMSGLLCDVYAPIECLGAFSLSYCIIGFMIGHIEESFINLNLFPKIFVLGFVSFLKDIIYYFAIGKNGDEILQAIASFSAPNALYTIIVGAVWFYLFSLIKKESKIEMYKQQRL